MVDADLVTFLGPHCNSSKAAQKCGPWALTGGLTNSNRPLLRPQRVGTRNYSQCAEKWYTAVSPSRVQRGDGGAGDDRRLLRALWAAGAAREFQLDWGALVRGRTAAQARRRWRLMVKMVPDARDRELPALLEYIVDKYAPAIRQQAEAAAAAAVEGGGT